MKTMFKVSKQEAIVMGLTRHIKWRGLLLTLVLLAVWACTGVDHQGNTLEAGAPAQRVYASPSAAAQDLVAALESEDRETIHFVLGPDVAQLGSGDPVADNRDREDFVAAAMKTYRIVNEDDKTAYMEVGPDHWRLPIPIVKEDDGWRFDTEEGVEEFLDLRIGRNELYTIATMRTYVDAQYEYAAINPTGDSVRLFAQRFGSSAGQKDGLYWPAAPGEPDSPLGPLMAEADEKGYFKTQSSEPVPYHGYYFRILTAQGENAPEGAMSYVVNGRMTRGFGLLAYPATYGNSGIMTFVVNQRGIVYQKDLGEDTRTLAERITAYDPDGSWQPVTEPAF
jgi:hypothetical protein